MDAMQCTFEDKLKISVVYIAACLLFAACANDNEGLEPSPEDAVVFTASMADDGVGSTRAFNAINSTNALKDAGGFGVYACYTGLYRYLESNVNPDYMYNEHVSWSEDKDAWVYSPVKYWPNGKGNINPNINTGEIPHYVSFMGYAPYRSAPDVCLYRFSTQKEKGNPWLEYRLHPDVNSQVDLLYARPLLDQKKQAVNERLLMIFYHALGCIGDRVTLRCGGDFVTWLQEQWTAHGYTEMTVQLTKVSLDYTLTERGRLVLWNETDDPNWQLQDGTTTTVRSVTLTEGLPATLYHRTTEQETVEPWTDTGHGVFFIPEHLYGHLQTAQISIEFTVTVSGGEEPLSNARTHTFTLSDYPQGYQHGKHLYINAWIGGTGTEPEVEGFLIDGVQMATGPWEQAEDLEHEVYNW